jgi:hypothetical protein
MHESISMSLFETQNADIALEHAEDKQIRALEEVVKELRERGLHLQQQ